MRTTFIAALLVAFSASAAAPVFASGYGPASSYMPSIGAPASQRGQSTQTLAADYADAQQAYGGGVSGQSQSAHRSPVTLGDSLYAHR